MTAEELFWEVAIELAAEDPRVVESTIMNGRCLRVEKEFLALIEYKGSLASARLAPPSTGSSRFSVSEHLRRSRMARMAEPSRIVRRGRGLSGGTKLASWGAPRMRGEAVQPTRLDSMLEWLLDALKPLAELESRAMFGGTGIYSEGTMFAILHDDRVYLKTDPKRRDVFVQRGCGPFQPRKGSTLVSYYEVPAEILDDEEELLAWARRAVLVARASPSKSKARGAVPPEEILEGYEEKIRALSEKLRLVVRDAAPDATEAGYRGWKLIGYRCAHYFCFIAPQRDHVRLGFEHGHRLADPDGLLEPMGKQVRFVRLLPGKRIPTAALSGLIRAARQILPERRAAKSR